MEDETSYYLKTIVTPLIVNADDLKIDRTSDEMGVLLTMRVSKEDMGLVIGRSGRTAKALRALLSSFGFKNRKRVSLIIAEPL